MRKKTIEEYLETIYVLQKSEGRAQTGKIALLMNVRPPSVTEILRKLEVQGLVERGPYSGATLSSSGKKIAQDLMKRHKIIADFLEIIGVNRELAEVDACQIEHHVNPETMNRLEKFVNFVREAPRDPKWIQHFRKFCETGERNGCSAQSFFEG